MVRSRPSPTIEGGRKRCPAAATNSSLYFAVICDIIASSDNMLFRGERMRIEFRTVYDRIEFEIFGQLYAKHCIEKQLKQLNNIRLAIVIICVLGFVLGLASDITAKDKFIPYTLFPFFLIFTLGYIWWVKKKLYPKTFVDINKIGCPYNVTFGLYGEYFYERFENNMIVSETSVRYEFLKRVVETCDYFILITNRTQVYFLPKRDMGYEETLSFSAFCKSRLGAIYKMADD